MAEHKALDAEHTLGTIDALVQDGLRSPHSESVSALEAVVSSLTALAASAHAGIARIRAAHNMRASGAARLSQEAITTIVLFLDKFEDRLTACQVCRLWRTVALDIPTPWPAVSCGAYAKSIAGFGQLKHVEADYDHCSGDILAPLGVINSDLKRLSVLRVLPGNAGLSVQLVLEAHCEGPFAESSDTPTGNVRRGVLQAALQSLTEPITRDMLSAAFSVEDKLFLDALHPLVTSAHRLSSLTLSVQCDNWLNIFLCLPPMPMLRALAITSRGEVLSLPDSLLRILATDEIPELAVAFPALQHLKIYDVQCAQADEETLDISSGRVASLLRSMPELRSLEVHLPFWPAIDAPADDSARAVFQSSAHAKLDSIILGSGGHSDPGNQDCSSFEELLNVLPITDSGSIEYRAAQCSSYDAVFSVLARADFLPTTLTAIFSPKTHWKGASLYVEATNAAGSRRVALAEGSCLWSGQGLAQYLSAASLTSLTLNIAAWDSLADGFPSRALERLEIVLRLSDVRVVSHRPVKVEFDPTTPPTRRMHLPALTTLAFGIHGSLRGKLTDYTSADVCLNVPISVLVAGIRAVSPSGALVDNLVIGEGIRPTPTAEAPDADPIAQLKTMCQSLVML